MKFCNDLPGVGLKLKKSFGVSLFSLITIAFWAKKPKILELFYGSDRKKRWLRRSWGGFSALVVLSQIMSK